MFLTTGEGVILVDAPPTLGPNLTAAIAERDRRAGHPRRLQPPPRRPHRRRRLSSPAPPSSPTRRRWSCSTRRDDPNRPLPTVTFADTYTLTVGSQTLQLDYHGNNHEPGNIFIYAPDQKVLMVVDIVFPGWVPFADLAIAEDVPGFVAAHDQILAYDFDTFVGGHLTRLGTREDVETARAYVMDVQANAARRCRRSTSWPSPRVTGFEQPVAALRRLPRRGRRRPARTRPLATWAGQLGGADVFTFGHCWAMMESLRVRCAPPG